jgi:hypothetical protein
VVAENIDGHIYFVFLALMVQRTLFLLLILMLLKHYQTAKSRGKAFYSNGCPIKDIAAAELCGDRL